MVEMGMGLWAMVATVVEVMVEHTIQVADMEEAMVATGVTVLVVVAVMDGIIHMAEASCAGSWLVDSALEIVEQAQAIDS